MGGFNPYAGYGGGNPYGGGGYQAAYPVNPYTLQPSPCTLLPTLLTLHPNPASYTLHRSVPRSLSSPVSSTDVQSLNPCNQPQNAPPPAGRILTPPLRCYQQNPDSSLTLRCDQKNPYASLQMLSAESSPLPQTKMLPAESSPLHSEITSRILMPPSVPTSGGLRAVRAVAGAAGTCFCFVINLNPLKT